MKKILTIFAVLTVLVAGGLSLFASSHPDGLEWSISKVTGKTELAAQGVAQKAAAAVVDKTALLPDYAFKGGQTKAEEIAGTSVSGITGSLIMLALAVVIGVGIHAAQRRKRGSKT